MNIYFYILSHLPECHVIIPFPAQLSKFANGFNSEAGEEGGILQNKETHSQISNKIIDKCKIQ